MIPEFVAEGLTTPTSSIALIALVAVVNTLNVEVSHLRRIYNVSVSNPTKWTSSTDLDGNTSDRILAVIPPRLPWPLRLIHAVGLASGLILAFIVQFAPSVSDKSSVVISLKCLVFQS